MSKCADSNCGYYWLEQGELYPRCHYPDDGTMAPCEYDDEPVDIDDDCGFDPYEGCYTYDC